MIEVFGRTDSSNCAKVFWVLEAMDLPWKLVPTGGKHGGTDTAYYRGLNPNGKVPTLVKGDVVVWESHAIMRYLTGQHGPTSLYPVDIRQRARVDMWLDWVATTLNPTLGTLRRAQGSSDKEKARPAAAAAFAMLDEVLGEHPYSAGASLTLADIAIAPHLMRWSRLPVSRPHLPRLDSYHDLLRRDPLYVRHVEASLDRL